MHAVTGPYAHAHPRGHAGRAQGHRDQRHAVARFRRRPSRSQPRLCQGPLRPADERRRARFRRRLGRRRRPQPDHRQEPVRDALGFAGAAGGQCAIWRRATPTASPASRARCRPAPPPTGSPKSSASRCTRRRPAGSSSAICSMPAASPSAARKARAPARTMCARRTGSGPCCSGSTSSPCASRASTRSCASTGRPTAATTTRATTMTRSTPPSPTS